MSTDTSTYAAGWYPDEHQPGMMRWYDGSSWTEHRQPTPHAAGAAQQGSVVGTIGVQPTRTSRLAVASLGTSLLGFGVIGIILGIAALVSIRKANPPGSITGRGLAIAGIVAGVVWGLIVVASLMAVAIPTILAQHQDSGRTVAAANVRQIVNELESCAAKNADGSYARCDGVPDGAAEQPVLAKGCGMPGGGCIELAADDMSYSVSAVTPKAPTATFTETHSPDGSIEKTCEPAGTGGCPDGGTW